MEIEKRKMKPAVYLQEGREATVLRGHPWIFPKAIHKESKHLVSGELVDVFTNKGQMLGTGVYNVHSLYRVRMLAYVFEDIDLSSLDSILRHRLRQAINVRKALLLPNDETNAYRLFNSEGDGLSGLTIDCFDQTIVVSSSAYWVELHREVISQHICELLSIEEVIWIASPKPLLQDGWQNEKVQNKQVMREVKEAGILFQVDFSHTQKTGLFLDQRENHQRIAKIAHGKKVLDLYTYTGGFALHAAKAGAKKVTAVDSSGDAIHLAKKNASLNQLDSIEFIEADARDYLASAGEYDLIILDPPKLAPSKKHLQQAKNYYRFLHRELFKSIKQGALLFTCNCSSALSIPEFADLVSMQASAQNKIARILGIYGPASCHPTLSAFPEGQYLTGILMAIV